MKAMHRLSIFAGGAILSLLPALGWAEPATAATSMSAIDPASPYMTPPLPSVYFSLGGGESTFTAADWKRNNGSNGDEASVYPINPPSKSDNHVSIYTGAIGYAFAAIPVRVELAYDGFSQAHYHWDRLLKKPNDWSQVADASVRTKAVLFNAYYDFVNQTSFTPYVTAGVGDSATRVQFNYSTTDQRDPDHATYRSENKTTHNTVWTIGGGVRYAITPNLFAGAQISYLDLGKAQVEYNLSGHEYPFATVNDLHTVLGTINLTYQL